MEYKLYVLSLEVLKEKLNLYLSRVEGPHTDKKL